MAIISAPQTVFLRSEIEHGDARRKKVALQEISRRYRVGDKLTAQNKTAFEKTINGMVLAETDPKVVRWCLNALARLGTRTGSSRYVVAALRQYQEDPEIVAAAVAALSTMYRGQLEEVPELGAVDPATRILAAMQTTEPRLLDLSGLKIDIERSGVEVLKLALITVGLNRDIENLLNPRHSNGTIVRQLGQHDDHIVRQYTVWSVLENVRLTLADLGIPFDDIDRQPVNVQAKLLQLAAERIEDPRERQVIIGKGSESPHAEARVGLAKGIARRYHEGLEDVTIRWYDEERDPAVRSLIVEHFGRFSDDSSPYFDRALEIVEEDPLLKDRILLGAEGTRLYATIKEKEVATGMGDLFPIAPNLAAIFQRQPMLEKRVKQMKVLFLAANPANQNNLRLDVEARDLREQLDLVKDATVEIEVLHAWAVKPDQIQKELLNARPDVLHFSGHGAHGILAFEDRDGKSVPISGDVLADLISLFRSIRCVVLNACFSEGIAKLVAPHVDGVVGCVGGVDGGAANLFTRSFYRALAHGRPVDEAFRLAKLDVSMQNMKGEADKYVLITR